MKAAISKLASKRRFTNPKQIGEHTGYVFNGQRLVIESMKMDIEDHSFATFTEWTSEADERAYRLL